MSHIAEEYAKCLGVRIGNPVISDHFYPLLADKFITFHTNEKKVPARQYAHWPIALYLIKKELAPNNIKIIQTGGPEDPLYKICDIHTQGCSFKQMTYIIKNSLLHLGIDSIPVHIASACDKKIVALYSNIFPECSGPLWNKLSGTTLLSPDFSTIKPSFAMEEKSTNGGENRVDEIKPEEIGCAVLDLLDIKHELTQHHTLSIGKHYHSTILEVVPDSPPAAGFKSESVVNLRCDYSCDDETLPLWLQHKTNLMISKALPENMLFHVRENIAGLTIFLGDDSITPKYIQTLNKFNLKFNLICRDKKRLADIRLEFFNWEVEEYIKTSKKDIDFSSEICDNTYYHSNKTLISGGKKYCSKAAWKAGIKKTKDHQKIIDNDDFWEELGHLYIYNHAKKKKDRPPVADNG